jgi:hypothetical protein
MKRTQVGTTFADWWAYKFRSKRRCHYNGPIMQCRFGGLPTALMMQKCQGRLNQRSEMSCEYGNIPEEKLEIALKFPQNYCISMIKVGSIKVGKDADVVL